MKAIYSLNVDQNHEFGKPHSRFKSFMVMIYADHGEIPVVAVSPVDAIAIALNATIELFSNSKVQVDEVIYNVDAQEDFDVIDQWFYWLAPKKIDFLLTQCEEHLKHLPTCENALVEVLGDSILCSECDGTKPISLCCASTGVICNETQYLRDQMVSDWRADRDDEPREDLEAI